MREKGARLLSKFANLTDVFRKVNAKSDPVVRTVKLGIMIKVIYDMYEHSSFMIKPLS